MSSKETEQEEQPVELNRDQFFHRIGIAEARFNSSLENLVDQFVEDKKDLVKALRMVTGMRLDIFESERDGLKLRFYEDGRRLFFTTEPKGQIGFVRKGNNGGENNIPTT